MSLETVIPPVPNIIFDEDNIENGFKMDYGKISFQGKLIYIKNVEIVISDEINIKFNFKEEDNQINMDNIFLNESYNFTISIINNDYNFTLKDFRKFILLSKDRYMLFFKEIYIKKGNINKLKNVKVWKLLQNVFIYQDEFKDLKIHDKNLYLVGENSKNYRIESLINQFSKESKNNLIDEDKQLNLIINELDQNRINSLKPFNAKGYFFFEDEYGAIKDEYGEIFDNLTSLIRFYSASNFMFNIEIIEDEDKNFELNYFTIENNFNYQNIFNNKESNLYNFLNSSYSQCEDLNDPISLLAYYYPIFMQSINYEVQIALESIFLEAFINFWIGSWDKSKDDLFINLNNALFRIGIDSSILTKIFLPDINIKFDELQKDFLKYKSKGMKKGHIKNIFKRFKNEFFIESVVVFRNKIIHTGMLVDNSEDIKEILNRIYKRSKKEYNGEKACILEKVYNFVLIKFQRYDLSSEDQFWAFEAIVNLILLTVLDSDCELDKSKFLGQNKEFFKPSAQDYVKQFLKC